jgi:tetratricopeptide (TPR) repeat protein
MARRHIMLTGVFALAVLTGCQTPYHKQVRNEATDRYELVNAQVEYDQAKQAFATGQFEKSLKLVNGAIARYPKRADYFVLQGRVFLETNRLEAALESFAKATEIDPEAPQPHYFTGIVFQRWSDHEKAVASYTRAAELDSESVQYLLASAESYVALQQYDDARRVLEERLNYFEHNAAMRQLLGQVSLLQGRPVDAVSHLREARVLNPDDPLLMEELARAEFAAGQFAQAHYSVERLQAMLGDDERPDLMHLEARCLAMLHRSSDARNLYLKLSQLTPADASVWIELGNVSYDLGDMRRVAMCASRAIALDPDRYEGHLLKGLSEQHLDNDAAAVASLRRASELAPAVAWPHLLLGLLLEEQGRRQDALNAYAAALRAEPDNADAKRLFDGLDSSTASVGSEH